MLKSQFHLQSGRAIGPDAPAYVIAEIGSNHDNDLEKAKFLIAEAKRAGADAAKFQSFQAHTLINRYNKASDAWQPHPAWEILDRLSMPESWHQALAEYAQHIGIDFLSAPFDEHRVELLHRLHVPIIKIASGDLTHHQLLKAVARTGKPIILSTGLAYLNEVEAAVEILKANGCAELVLLHCVSLYPPQFSHANIRAMATMAQHFQVPVGYSDHTPGMTVPLGAVALGASVIEKHLTDSRQNAGPDHPYALEVHEFQAMVQEIRHLEAALGDGIKAPPEAEVPERVGARRALYANAHLPVGTILQPEHFKAVRHAYAEGIAADQYQQVIGKKLARAHDEHDLFTWESFES